MLTDDLEEYRRACKELGRVIADEARKDLEKLRGSRAMQLTVVAALIALFGAAILYECAQR